MKPIVKKICQEITEMCDGYFESTDNLYRRLNEDYELVIHDNGTRAPDFFVAVYNAVNRGMEYFSDLSDIAMYFIEQDPEGILTEDVDADDYEIKIAYYSDREVPDWGFIFREAPNDEVTAFVGIHLTNWGS